jgi:hypothetical protein
VGHNPDDALPPFADDPDPGGRATALRALRDCPRLLGHLARNPHDDVRTRALSLLSRHQQLG